MCRRFARGPFLRRRAEREKVQELAGAHQPAAAQDRARGRSLLRRQPAEGPARQEPDPRGEAVRVRRADRRGRRRHPGRDLRVHPRSLRGRRGDPADLLRPARDPAPDEPRLRHVSRPAARRAHRERDRPRKRCSATSSSARRHDRSMRDETARRPPARPCAGSSSPSCAWACCRSCCSSRSSCSPCSRTIS